MSSKSVLIIDDDFDVGESLQTLLKLNNFESSIALSGKEGIDKFQTSKFDIILLDIKMPKMDGYETFDKLLEMDPNVKVFFVTGHSTNNKKLQHCKNHGLRGILTKPVDISKIIQVINSLN